MTKKEKLAAYEKANKTEKKAILKAAGLTEEAYLASLKETRGRKPKEAKETEPDNKPYDMVVAFDSTGSMSSYLTAVRKHVSELIPRMFSTVPNLRMKIVVFGDYCDISSPKLFGKAYQESDFTDNQNSLMSFVNSAKDTSGGDGDEFYELVIKKVVEETPWREDSTRVFLLIGDCDPHPIGYSCGSMIKNNQIDWKEECKKAASKGIQIDTLSILPKYAHYYEEMSKITNGIHLPFKSSNKVSKVMEASTYVRSKSGASKAMYSSMKAEALSSGDTELIGAFKKMDSKL